MKKTTGKKKLANKKDKCCDCGCCKGKCDCGCDCCKGGKCCCD